MENIYIEMGEERNRLALIRPFAILTFSNEMPQYEDECSTALDSEA